MIKVPEFCNICGRVLVSKIPGSLAPFVAERCGIVLIPEIFMLRCEHCEFQYFDHRYTDAEIKKIYRDYRGSTYVAQRLRIEPSYAKEWEWISEDRWKSDRIIETCQRFEHWQLRCPKRVLDYGGEDGWLSRHVFPESEVVVYDISHDCPEPEGRFDLVFAAFILEHVCDPLNFVHTLMQFIVPGGYLYLEVPRVTDLPIMHEHVSQWSSRALRSLVSLIGMNTIEVILPNDTDVAILARRKV